MYNHLLRSISIYCNQIILGQRYNNFIHLDRSHKQGLQPVFYQFTNMHNVNTFLGSKHLKMVY
jgi:hypothetical protein